MRKIVFLFCLPAVLLLTLFLGCGKEAVIPYQLSEQERQAQAEQQAELTRLSKANAVLSVEVGSLRTQRWVLVLASVLTFLLGLGFGSGSKPDAEKPPET
jgi:cell division protein FtsB